MHVSYGQYAEQNPLLTRAAVINDTLGTVDRLKHNSELVLPSRDPRLGKLNGNQVKVQNLTGSDRALGEVVTLGNYLLNLTTAAPGNQLEQGLLFFQGNAAASPYRKLAVLSRAAKHDANNQPDSEIVTAAIAGVCIASVNLTSTGHTHADLTSAATYILQSSTAGGRFELLSQANGTGIQLMAVLFNSRTTKARHIHFTLTQALMTSDLKATCTVDYFYDGFDPESDPDFVSEVYNSQNAWAGSGGAQGGASYDPEADRYWIDWLECM